MGNYSKKTIILHKEILPKQTQRAFEYLSKQLWLEESSWYLAGGTALALQAGHRGSVDLDFFTPQKKFNSVNILKHFLNNKNWKTTIVEEGTIYGELFGAKISFIAYPFFKPMQKQICYGAIKIIQPVDIAVMKIMAISQRGRKRDFFDLYWCAKNIESLDKTIRHLKKQYPKIVHNYHHILKSLVYFIDAENDPEPTIYFNANWKKVKKFFLTEILTITDKILNLGI